CCAGGRKGLDSAFNCFVAASTASLYLFTASSHFCTFGPDNLSTLTVPVGHSAPACIVLQNTSGAAAVALLCCAGRGCCAFTVASERPTTRTATDTRKMLVMGFL